MADEESLSLALARFPRRTGDSNSGGVYKGSYDVAINDAIARGKRGGNNMRNIRVKVIRRFR